MPVEITAVGVGNFTGDGEAEAHAAFAFGEEGVAAVEECVWGEAGAGVFDLEGEMGVGGVQGEFDFAAGRGGLDGVEDEVGEGLVEAVGVAEDGGG